MKDQLLSKMAVLVAVVAGVTGLLGSFVVLPHRMNAAEEKLRRMEIKQESMQDVLIRVDENVKRLLVK